MRESRLSVVAGLGASSPRNPVGGYHGVEHPAYTRQPVIPGNEPGAAMNQRHPLGRRQGEGHRQNPR
jgi:hypothetical protein